MTTPLDNAEKAYELALFYHKRNDVSSMARWIRVYGELLKDAGTYLQASEDHSFRLVDGNPRRGERPVSDDGCFYIRTSNGYAVAGGHRVGRRSE